MDADFHPTPPPGGILATIATITALSNNGNCAVTV